MRWYENQSPLWEAYGIDHSVYGAGDTLEVAREDVKSSIALHLEAEEGTIELDEFHEHLVRPEDSNFPDVWVRTLQDFNAQRMLPNVCSSV